jgi:hypothetical protein
MRTSPTASAGAGPARAFGSYAKVLSHPLRTIEPSMVAQRGNRGREQWGAKRCREETEEGAMEHR